MAEALERLFEVWFHVGTMCSGTERPLLALNKAKRGLLLLVSAELIQTPCLADAVLLYRFGVEFVDCSCGSSGPEAVDSSLLYISPPVVSSDYRKYNAFSLSSPSWSHFDPTEVLTRDSFLC